jgi:tetratricopeptide (TPR) repeat protein
MEWGLKLIKPWKVCHKNVWKLIRVLEVRQRLITQELNTNAILAPVVEKFLVPYDENPHFVGRKELLKTLRKKLCEVEQKRYNHRVALYGLGGVGKTQTALAYVYAHKSDYDAIYWITGVNEASLLSGFQEIAKTTGLLKGKAEIQPTEVAKTVLLWLRNQDNWLFVIDNLDDVSVVGGYLPHRNERKHTIITTRNPNFDEIPAEGLEIEVLDSKDATELLIIRSKVGTKGDPQQIEAEAAQIVKELGYLALAIEQAAAFIRETSRDIFKYLPSYRADRRKHHARVPRGNWEYSKAVATTWHLSFRETEKNHNRGCKLLKLFSFLNPDGILLEFLEAGKEGLSKSMQDLIDDEDEFYEALAELERFSLIRREDEGLDHQITIHRLVQAVIKDEMEDDTFSTMTQWAISLCDLAFPQNWVKEMRLVCRKFQEQVVVTLSDIKGVETETFLRVLKRVGTFLQEDGKYEQAGQLLSKVVDVSTALNGPEHIDTLRATAQLAETYRNQRRWQEAINLQQHILKVASRVFGDDDQYTWTAMGDLAATYRSTGRRKEAVQMQEKVLEVRLKELEEDHPDTIRAKGNLAATYHNLQRLDEAVRLREEVLETRKRLLGDDQSETLRAMVNLAVTYRSQKDVIRAAQLEEKVLEIRTATLGLEHPDTLDVMRNLAISYSLQKRNEDAIELQQIVLDTRAKIIGEEHPDTIWDVAHLAKTYSLLKKWEKAVELRETVLKAREKILGEEHPDTIRALADLAETYHYQGRLSEAANLRERVLDMRRKKFGNDHYETQWAMKNLIKTYHSQNRFEEAEKLEEDIKKRDLDKHIA